MLKIIKKSFKYLTILIGIIILVPTAFSLILRIPEVQTFIVKRITGHISETIKSTITVAKVEYSFFNKLAITDLLIKDQNNDTMLYVSKVETGILRLDVTGKVIKLGNVNLVNPAVALITDSTGLMNLTWYLDKLRSSDTTKGKSNSIFSINRINLKEGSFLLRNNGNPGNKIELDFNNLRLSGINGYVEDLKVANDSTTFRINDLEFNEYKGFLVRSMSSRMVLANHSIIFRDLFLYLDSSIINADHLIITGDPVNSFQNFSEDARIDFLFQKSLISCSDLRYFIPALKGMDASIQLSGKISGTLAELKGRKMLIEYQSRNKLDCDFDLSGVQSFRDAFIHIRVNNLTANAEDFSSMRLPGQKYLKLPNVFYKLGSISFNGSFTGFLNDFVTYGNLGTEIGNLSTDISLRPEEKNRFHIKGLIKGAGIDLGKLASSSDLLGRLSMEANVDGYATSSDKVSGSLTGKIDSIEVNRYIYRNISLKGIFTENTWDGSIKISDRNIKMDMLGLLDFSRDLPEFDFTLNLSDANLYKLNVDKTDTTSRISLLATANFRGNSIDNLFGEIRLLNSSLIKYGNKLDLYNFSLKAFNENNKPAISLQTDFLDADLKGYYEFGEMGYLVKRALASLIPLKYNAPAQIKSPLRNEFTFALNFKNSDKINDFFRTGIHLSDKSSITGTFYQDSLILINANARTLNYRNNIFSNLTLNAYYSGTNFSSDLRSSSVSVLGQAGLQNFHAGFYIKPDNFNFNINWDNKEKIPQKGDFIARGLFFKDSEKPDRILLKIDIDSSRVLTTDNTWLIKQSSILIDSIETHIDKFILAGNNNSFLVNGTISPRRQDTLRLEFNGIDLSMLGKRGLKDKNGSSSSGFQLNLKGILNGNVAISSAKDNPLIESGITVNGFSILGGDYGDLTATSEWNPSKKVAEINASNNLNGREALIVKGIYDPGVKRFNLTGTAANLPVDALNQLLGFFASDVSGTVSGKVNLSGAPGSLYLTGALMAENTSMKINYLQTKYRVNDSIRFDRKGIKFRNIKVFDEKGNSAILSGSVFHNHFSDFAVDLTINMDKNDVFVLNTHEKDNQLFYGTAYGTGLTTIRSGPNLLSFDISAKTGKGTKIFIPLNAGESISEFPFITFVNRDTTGSAVESKLKITPVQTSGSSLELNFDLDVTPDAEIQLLIDPKAGDVIKGTGEGKLNISLNKKGEFRIYGDYVIDEGEYLFTLQNILNKRFDVESGGKITFNGAVENSTIDLIAKYKNLKTSLFPILQDERYNTRISVEPQLLLSGNLFNPLVNFNIYLPNSDEETRTYLKNAISTEEELSRQFLYLLVMNSFYSDASFRSTSGTAPSGTSAMAVTTTEMLSNQLSNWLSQISKDFDVGFVYRPGNKDINTQELQVALSTQLLNDKITINGNFDYRGENNPAGTPLSGDFDIEYKITEKIRFKAFNRYNNPYTGKGVPYTQGLGVFFKQDFNKLSDFLGKKPKSDIKKEDEVKVK